MDTSDVNFTIWGCLFFLVFSYIYLRVGHNKSWLEALLPGDEGLSTVSLPNGDLARVFYWFSVKS